MTGVRLQLGQLGGEGAFVLFGAGRHFEFERARNAFQSLQSVVRPAQFVKILVQVFITQSIALLQIKTSTTKNNQNRRNLPKLESK